MKQTVAYRNTHTHKYAHYYRVYFLTYIFFFLVFLDYTNTNIQLRKRKPCYIEKYSNTTVVGN